jgi:hypothetical protein
LLQTISIMTELTTLRYRAIAFTTLIILCASAGNVAAQCNTGNLTATPPSLCASAPGPVTLQLTGYSAGASIQWQGSPPPVGMMPFTNIGIATTSPTFTVPQAMTGWCYRAVVTCAVGNSAVSNAVCLGAGGPTCQDSVWPGDANYDLVANNLDMLAIATSWGLTGPARTGASNNWTAQFAMNWTQVFSNLMNKKNADCDGNGVIGWSDTLAVSQNYGMVHLRPAEEDAPTEKTAGLPDLSVDLTGIAMVPGSTITAPIRVGNSANPVTKIYGLAATVKMSGTANSGPPTVTLNPTWMGTPAQVLRFAKTTSSTTADFVASRMTRRDTTGYGTLGTVTFALPANSTGKVKVSLQNVRLIDSSGAILTAYNVLADSANVSSTGIAHTASCLTSVIILPNPGAASSVEVRLAKATQLDVVVIDALGKEVWRTSTETSVGTHRISLPGGALPTGIYSVRVQGVDAGDRTTLRWLKQ